MGSENKEIFARNLRNFILKSGKDRTDIAKDLGLPYSTLTDWVNGNKYPRIHNIEKLATYFGLSKMDLIEDFEAKRKDNERLAAIIVRLRMDEDLLDIVDNLSRLDRDKLEKLRGLLNTVT